LIYKEKEEKMKFRKLRSAYKVSAPRKSCGGAAGERQRYTDKEKIEIRYVTRTNPEKLIIKTDFRTGLNLLTIGA
jgi:hypothetical protein